MLLLTVVALLVLAILAVTMNGGWGDDGAGRHQRSRSGPVRGDGSGWTEEGLARQFPGAGFNEGAPEPSPYRGPEDDPAFLEHLSRLNRSNRPEPPFEN